MTTSSLVRAAFLCLLVTPVCLLAMPASMATAQNLDDLMEADPEGEDDDEDAEGEGEGGEGADEGFMEDEAPPGDPEDFGDDERPPGDPTAFADPDADDDEPVELDEPGVGPFAGVLIGYGVSLEDGPNAWSFGFGLQGGYDIGSFTFGGRFVYYIGGSHTETRQSFSGGTQTEEISANLWELGGEIGLDIEASATLLVRPLFGLGLANFSVESVSEAYAFIAPGLAVLYGVSDVMYLGLDSRFQVVLSDPEATNALVFLAALGMRF